METGSLHQEGLDKLALEKVREESIEKEESRKWLCLHTHCSTSGCVTYQKVGKKIKCIGEEKYCEELKELCLPCAGEEDAETLLNGK